MKTRLPIALLLLAAFSPPAAPAGGDPNAPSRIYRLETGAGYSVGCVDPCDCAIFHQDGLRGTFRLQPDPGTVADDYRVRDLLWVAAHPDGRELRVHGNGRLVVGDASFRMVLDLRVNDGAPIRYEGTGIAAEFPRRFELELGIPGAGCRSSWIRLAAASVPVAEIRPYDLTMESAYVSGCVTGACACPVTRQPMAGRFGLVELPGDERFHEFALVDVRWHLQPPPGTIGPGEPVRGAAIYRVRGPLHQMFGGFSVAGQPPKPYQGGPVRGADPPFLRIAIATPTDGCLGEELHLSAAPAPSATDPALP